jgi:hypothetical protein
VKGVMLPKGRDVGRCGGCGVMVADELYIKRVLSAWDGFLFFSR